MFPMLLSHRGTGGSVGGEIHTSVAIREQDFEMKFQKGEYGIHNHGIFIRANRR